MTNRSKPKNGMKRKNKTRIVVKTDPPFPLYSNPLTKTFDEGFASVANLLMGRRNILVLAGAGLSVSCGIPDFRSRGTGLYSTLDARALGLSCPEDLFDLEVFNEDPGPFYRFAKSLYPGTVQPSTSHRFLALLEEKKMLLRIYTQNIDGLEEISGISPKKIVHAHGSLSWARCTKCRHRMNASFIAEDVMAGTVPCCSKPVGKGANKRIHKDLGTSMETGKPSQVWPVSDQSTASKRARTMTNRMLSSIGEGYFDNDDNQSNGCRPYYEGPTCGGIIKPGVTFFGEKLEDKVRRTLEADRSKADALVVIGTSLSVAPMSKVIQYLPPSIPRILINRSNVKAPGKTAKNDDDSDDSEEDFRDDYVFDASLLGNCDDVTRALMREMGWAEQDDDALNYQPGEAQHYLREDRTFQFPGAVSDDSDDSDLISVEVVHCDGCQKEINGTIMKCMQCFDFDLCKKCFRTQSKKHFKGKHKFSEER